MFRTERSTVRTAAALLAAALLTACGAATTPSIEPATPSEIAAPSPSPSPPVDVAAEFAAIVESPAFSVEAVITGTIAVGQGEGTIAGSLTSGASANHLVMEITLPGQTSQVTETILVGGRTYDREGDLWFEGGAQSGNDAFLTALGDLDSLREAGPVVRHGEQLHRLVTGRGADLDAASLGFTDASVTGFEADVEFFAADDGTPAGLALSAAWEQDVNGTPMDATMTLDYTFTSVGRPVDIAAPEEVWVRFTSDEFGYRMAYPATWDFVHVPAEGEAAATDAFLAPTMTGPVPTEVDIYHYPDLEAGIPPNAWFRESVVVLEERWGTALETSDAIEVNGIDARLFTLHGTDGDGNAAYFQEVALFAGTAAWDIDWYSAPGTEAADRELLLTMLSTFRPAP